MKYYNLPANWKLDSLDNISVITRLAGAEYSDLWEEDENGSIIAIRGFNIGKNKLILNEYSRISISLSERLSRSKLYKGDIVFPCVGTIGNACVIREDNKFHINQNIAKITVSKGISSEYLCQYLMSDLTKREINRFNATTSQPNVLVGSLRQFKIIVPTLEEQEKIAEILSTWDVSIEKQEQLIEKKKEFKKGLMQRLLSGEVRFKEFKDEWKVVNLGNIFERVTQKNDVECTNVLTISAQNGLVNQEDYFNKSVSSKDLSGYYLLNKGDFAYNKSYSNGYPLGAIKRLNNYDKGVVSPLYICFRAKEKISTCFYEQYFESGFLNKEIFKIAQEGARNHGLLNVSVTEFFKDIKIAKPSLEEQNKIAEVLIEADKEIELLEKELEALKLQKKGLMQRLLTGEVRVKV